ncbi:MAG: putative naringenin-chalcone synthase [Candidatus Omnitrophota bacterium]|jgi:predicted naringenin-chalcone synthase
MSIPALKTSRQYYAALTGLGQAKPAHSMAQLETAELASSLNCQTDKHRRILPILYKKTRVQRRASVLSPVKTKESIGFHDFYTAPDEKNALGPGTAERMLCYADEAPKLAYAASRGALEDAKVTPDQITHLISVSCTGFKAPGFDIELIKKIKLPSSVERTHIGFMGCHGVFNAMRIAKSFAQNNANAKILLCSVELCSLHFSYGWNPDQIVANALFADGASAAVIEAQSSAAMYNLQATGSYLFNDSQDAMTWTISDHGFKMTLSSEVPHLIEQHLEAWVAGWLAKYDLKISDIQSWAVHPGGPRLLDSVQKALSLAPDDLQISRDILAKHGNMSSATILYILEEFSKRKNPVPCVALGFGPGLVAEAFLIL